MKEKAIGAYWAMPSLDDYNDFNTDYLRDTYLCAIANTLQDANKLKLIKLKLYAKNHGQFKELNEYLEENDD